MNEIIALHERIAARRARLVPAPFTLQRIDGARFLVQEKGPDKRCELRGSRPIARLEALRLRPIAERTSVVERVSWRARRVRQASQVGKMRLFRLWKSFVKPAEAEVRTETPLEDLAPRRPRAERLAWLRRAPRA